MKHQKSILAGAILLCSTPLLAASFSPMDARSLSMGGVGVAGARAASAGLFNPALLAVQPKDRGFSLILPTVGVVVDDKDDVVNTLDDVQNGSLQALENAIDQGNQSGFINPSDVSALDPALRNFAGDLPRLGGKPVNLDVGAGLGFGMPGKELGVGLNVHGTLTAGVVINVANSDVANLNTLAGYAQDGIFDAAERANTTFFNATGTALKPVDEIITSSISILGVAITEAGLSLAREFTIAGQTLALGITPKLVQVDTIYYTQAVNSNDLGDTIEDEKYRKKYDDFNMDMGVAQVYGEEETALTVGLVIKNLISNSYQTAADVNGKTHEIEIRPQLRAGVNKRWNRRSVGADLDLSRNKSAGLVADSQFLSVGAEYDLTYLQLRAGFRHNLVSDGVEDMLTAGLGLGPLDITALYASEHSLGVNVQLGFSF